jgi:protease-4
MFKIRSLYSPRSVKKKKAQGQSPLVFRILRRFVMGIGFFVLFIVAYGVIAASLFQQNAALPVLPDEMVLYLKIDQPIVEVQDTASFMNPFEPLPPTLRMVVEAIDRGASDKRVKGLYVRFAEGSFDITQAQEIRAAVKRFAAAGKFTKMYASSLDGGLADVYLAAAFQERWMQPMGVVNIAGLRAEVPFFRGLLDKLGVEPNFYQRKAYKTAYESFTAREMSEANRESLTGIVDSIRKVVMVDVPADLGIDAEAFESVVDQGILLADEALKAKVITHADYVDVLIDGLRKDIQGDPESEEPLFVTLDAYAMDAQEQHDIMAHKKPIVALVHVKGAIMDSNPNGGDIAAADEIAPAIWDAAKDEEVKAIVVRIDSPGGSPVASESILRAITKAKERGKPVIVSMGTVAASGGYWVALGADKIYALPTTMTGSIGVVGGKFAAADEAWDKIGVEWDRSIAWGDNAGIWSINEAFTQGQERRVNAMLDHVYKSFVSRVAAGRKLTPEQAEAVAQGRVWAGSDAVENGLVDALGGLQDALAYVAQMNGGKTPDDLYVVEMPEPLSPFEQLLEMFSEQGMVIEGLKFQSQIFGFLKPYVQEAAVMTGGDPVLAYEPMRVR